MMVISILGYASIYAITGALTGLLSGLLGLGGGLIVVPALLYIFHLTHSIPPDLHMHVAAGSSLAIMIFTGLASIRAHHNIGGILWSVYYRLWPGIVIGTIAGAVLADHMSTHWLKVLFGLFLLFVSINMISNINITRRAIRPRKWVNRLVSVLIGFKSGLLGIGGGALVIPYLNYCGVNAQKIPAVSSLCTLTVAVTGTIAVMITGINELHLPAYCTGYIYWPAVILIAFPSVFFAPVGARLTYTLPVKQLKYGFVIILLIATFNLLY